MKKQKTLTDPSSGSGERVVGGSFVDGTREQRDEEFATSEGDEGLDCRGGRA